MAPEALIRMACALVLPLTSVAQPVGPAAMGGVINGKQIFETRCVACHALDTHRVGPALRTVVGRRAGQAADFAYSAALGKASHTWSRDKLLAWLTDPEALVPGQGMGYRVESAGDRLDVVAYLASVQSSPPTFPRSIP